MLFDLKVMGAAGEVSQLRLEARDERSAMQQAEANGYVVLVVRRPSIGFVLPQLRRSSSFPLLLFSQELLALLESGLALLEALEALSEKEHNTSIRTVLENIITSLKEGRTLSSAFEGLSDIFPTLYVASVRASEKTGDLPEALQRYVQYQSQADVVRKKIINASIYPVLLLVVGTVVTLFLMTYVVPRFSVIYESNEKALPWMSQVLMGWGRLWSAHGKLIFLGFILAFTTFIFTVTRPQVRVWLWRQLWMLPTIGERMFMYQLTRFYRTLAMLLKSGIPIVTSLDMVSGLLDANLQQRLLQANRDIREGHSISEALEQHGLTTPVALRMLRVGERSGKMGEMMDRIAAFYDEEMARWVEWFARLFEPILMAVIGIMIGAIVVLMYLPVFELADSFN
jgi:general secretion pathway protein F